MKKLVMLVGLVGLIAFGTGCQTVTQSVSPGGIKSLKLGFETVSNDGKKIDGAMVTINNVTKTNNPAFFDVPRDKFEVRFDAPGYYSRRVGLEAQAQILDSAKANSPLIFFIATYPMAMLGDHLTGANKAYEVAGQKLKEGEVLYCPLVPIGGSRPPPLTKR